MDVKISPMVKRYVLILLMGISWVGFGVRVLSLDAQSMWRDEIDTLCFAQDFWDVIQKAAGRNLAQPPMNANPLPSANNASGDAVQPTATSSISPVAISRCKPTPGLASLDPTQGLWPTLRALLTLPGWNGPLYTVAMRPWISVTGDSPFAVRFSSVLSGMLAVPLTYVLGKRLFGLPIGLTAASLVALSPHLVWYSQEAKMYGAIMALGLLSVYSLRRALDNDRGGARWWAATVIATTLAFYSHILAALLIPLLAALGLIWWPNTRRHWQGALVALSCLTLPYLPLLAWQARNWLLPSGQATLFTMNRLDSMLEITFDGWSGHYAPAPWSSVVMVGLALLALVGVASVLLATSEPEQAVATTTDQMRKLAPWREVLALLAWIFVPIFGIWLISARQPIFTNRYLVWAAPAFYLLAAVGFVALLRAGLIGTLVAAALMLAILISNGNALQHQATQPIKPDFRAAAAYIEQQYQPGDLIIFHLSYLENNFDYYYAGSFDGWGAPAPASGLSESDINSFMVANTTGRSTVWLVLSEAEMWDPQGMVKAWLDGNAGQPIIEQVFAHVTIYKYQRQN
jgi:hypothetical protein